MFFHVQMRIGSDGSPAHPPEFAHNGETRHVNLPNLTRYVTQNRQAILSDRHITEFNHGVERVTLVINRCLKVF